VATAGGSDIGWAFSQWAFLMAMSIAWNQYVFRKCLMALVVAIATCASAACLPSPLVDCGDDTSCAQPTSCLFTENRLQKRVAICVGDESFAQCVDRTLGDKCVDNQGAAIGDTICVQSVDGDIVCAASRCGDGKVLGREVCDDGNVANGDGCSSDCLSDETCGNQIIDGVVGGNIGEQCDQGIKGLSGDGCSSKCTVETDRWINVSAEEIPPMSEPALAYDIARGVTVMFDSSGKTWEFDGTGWSQWRGSSPPQFRTPEMVYDSKRRVMVLVGRRPQTDEDNQTWEFNGFEWKQRASLSKRENFAMAYDAARSRTVVYGGEYTTVSGTMVKQTIIGDVWEFDGERWVENLAPSPPARVGAAMAFDDSRNKIVMHGGKDSNQRVLNQTWEFDGFAWAGPFDSAAPAFERHAMFYSLDVATKGVMMVGSPNSSTPSSVWKWNSSARTWQMLSSSGQPTNRTRYRISYDRRRHRGVLFGSQTSVFGDNNKTWELTSITAASTQWDQILADKDASPPTLAAPSVASAFDSRRGILVLRFNSKTWEFNNRSWRDVTGDNLGSLTDAAMAYDSKRGVTVLYGNPTITAQYNGVSWQNVDLPVQPENLANVSMAFDLGRNLIVLVGTNVRSEVETWEFKSSFKSSMWTKKSSPQLQPNDLAARHAVLFDSDQQQVLLFAAAAMYQYDGSLWTKRDVADEPKISSNADVAFDSTRKQVVAVNAGITWHLVRQTASTWRWEQSSPAVSPSKLRAAALHYDPNHQQLVLFVGTSVFAETLDPVVDTWAYRFSSSVAVDFCIAGLDSDGDGLFACGDAIHKADPDCYGRCFPLCPIPSLDPSQPACNLTSLPHCGDGVCNAFLEDTLLCPTDCP
jgi:cysteine-rich repeat protein